MPVDLPPKKEVATALLQQSTVFIHLDPRAEDVIVPPWFKKQPRLVLQIGLNMPVPIPDLHLDDEGVSCTLSFNRSPCFCRIPWKAVFALISEDRRGMVWPDDVPREVAVQVQGPARQELERARTAKRPHLRSVPTGPDATGAGDVQQPSTQAAAREQMSSRQAGESAQPSAEAAPAATTTLTGAKPKRSAVKKKPAKKSQPTAKKTAKKPEKKLPTKKSAPAKKKSPAKKRPAKKTAAVKSAGAKAKGTAAAGKKKASTRTPAAAPAPGKGKRPASRKESSRPAASRGNESTARGETTKRKLPPYLRVVK